MEEVIRTRQKSNIEVSAFHTEEVHQLEFSTYPFPPMQELDNLMYAYELPCTTAVKREYRATVAINPLFGEFPGSTYGLHLSI